MNAWLVASIILAGATLPCLAVAVLTDVAEALVAFEVAGTLITTALMTLAEGTGRAPFIDLGLVLGVLSLLGAIVFARMLEGDVPLPEGEQR
jgi:multisubunit Na+/H+ antiporter MnhF subunit